MKLLNIEIKYYFLIHTHTHTHLTLYAKFNMHRTSVSYTIVTVDLSLDIEPKGPVAFPYNQFSNN